jgi:uncharacterized protein YaiI (UPF0178 family)
MKIWVDADACPKIIKDILFRAAIRTQTELILVANHALPAPPSIFIKKLQVTSGLDVADNKILEQMQPGDLVITADIPLAHAIVQKAGVALNPRGELYTKNNIQQCLNARNFNETLRESGLISGGPSKLTQRDSHTFARALDQLLLKANKL